MIHCFIQFRSQASGAWSWCVVTICWRQYMKISITVESEWKEVLFSKWSLSFQFEIDINSAADWMKRTHEDHPSSFVYRSGSAYDCYENFHMMIYSNDYSIFFSQIIAILTLQHFMCSDAIRTMSYWHL